MMKPHALVVGGTGMLAEVCFVLARRGYMLSVLARGRDGLHSLSERFGANGLKYNPVHVDYRDTKRMRALLDTAVITYGPVDLCVSWIHSSAPEATRVAAEAVDTGPGRCRFYDLRPSWSAAPDAPPWDRETTVARLPHVDYHSITLGFVQGEDGARWLTSPEIAAGVLDAVDSGKRESIIGTVTPWESRPPRTADPR